MSGFIFICFVLGLVSAAPVGPLCILVFNRSARAGFWHGWVTGLGSALADGCYCALGLAGLLQPLGIQHHLLAWLYRSGGVALAAMGMVLLFARAPQQPREQRARGYIASLLQGFMLTFLNPMVILFFMTAGMHLIALQATQVTSHQVVLGTITMCLGVLTVITGVSAFGARIGTVLSAHRIRQMRILSGVVLVLLGVGVLSGVVAKTPALLSRLAQLFS